jgi:hypothetical protein
VRGAKENLCRESLTGLKIELRKAKERLRHKKDVSWVASGSRDSRFRYPCWDQ